MAPSTRLDQDALFRVLEQQLDVISRQQALAAGLTKHALAHRLRLGGPWRGLLPGVYMAANGAPTTLQQEMAALLYAGPGSVITGPAALRSHHIRTELTEIIDVLVPSTKTLARGRRMARYQIVVLRFTPRQIRTQPAGVINDIKAALDGARGHPPIKLKTIKANNGAAA